MRAPQNRCFRSICALLTAVLCATPGWGATLAAYWNLDEGSGTTAADVSGSGNTGTLVNSPAWTTGHSGSALNFVAGGKGYMSASGAASLANLFVHGMSVSVWVKPRSGGGGGGGGGGRIIDKDNNNGGWFLAMNGATGIRFAVDTFPTVSPSRVSTATVQANTWQHVAVTWDGSVSGSNIHIYLNGVLADGAALDGAGVAQPDDSTPLALGNRSLDLARSFDGAIDEVRVYSGILTAAEIQALANVAGPTAPVSLTAARTSGTQVNLTWGASTDSVPITGYLVERCSGVGCTSFTQIANPAGTSYTDSGLTASSSYGYRVRAQDATTIGPYSNTATAAPPDTQAPTVPTGLESTGVTTTSIALAWTASTDLPTSGGTGVAGYLVYRDGNAATAIATVKGGTSFTDSGLSAGTTYSYQVAAFDAATPANVSAPSTALEVTTQSASPLTGGDVGAVAAKGSSSDNAGTYTISGSGVDIQGTADSFQFDSEAFTGDGTITARVVSQTDTNAWAKAGVMFRETLGSGSSFAAVLLTANNPPVIEARIGTGNAAVYLKGAKVLAPYWVRLTRAGNSFTGYISADGKTWTSIGNFTVPMASQLRVGLAVTSLVNGVLNKAVFDSVSITTSAGPLQVTVSPSAPTVLVGGTQQFSASVTNATNTAVTWQVNGVTGGSSSTGTISSAGLYAAPTSITTSPSSFTIGAVSVQDPSVSGTGRVTVVRPVASAIDVTTYKYDLARTGLNPQETVLTTSNVRSATFGLLRVLPGDGAVFAEPLFLSALNIGGSVHNVIFVATEHNSVYAYDADSGTKLWQVSVNVAGETTSDNRSCDQVSPEIGITATPVIDRSAGPHGTMYVVAMSRDSSGGYHQRIHALDVTTGSESLNGPTEIVATYPTAGGGSTTFDPGAYKERAGLLLLNGEIYTTWSSHCDNTPYTGWIIAYSGATLARTRVLNIAPNSKSLGPAIWQSGGAPAADANGFIYLLAANGVFETTLDANGFPSAQDYGNSFLKISTAGNSLSVADYFAMWNEVSESSADLDLGSGGAILLPDLTDATGAIEHLALGAGKDGNIYVVSRDSLGKFNPSKNNIWQQIDQGGAEIRSTPAYFNGQVYLSARDVGLNAFSITSAKLSASPTSHTSAAFGYPGTIPVVSSNGTTNGIVWASTVSNPSVLYAYDATNLATQLYNSSQAPNSRDNFGVANKYNSPTVVAAKVFVGTKTGVAVFGLLH
jgi:regulation of enolase protein 1 (concanavalin A-like superfamily)